MAACLRLLPCAHHCNCCRGKPEQNQASVTLRQLFPKLLYHKRLEQGRFACLWEQGDGTCVELIMSELALSPTTQKALADAFYSALYNAASTRCKMVREPGPGTMRWRVALVDASSSNPFLNMLSTFEPHVKVADMLAGVVFDGGVAYWVGQATAQGYAKDATTGALLWEGQDSRAGTKAFMRDTLSSWVDVDNAFKTWADQFAQRLSDWGACSQKK